MKCSIFVLWAGTSVKCQLSWKRESDMIICNASLQAQMETIEIFTINTKLPMSWKRESDMIICNASLQAQMETIEIFTINTKLPMLSLQCKCSDISKTVTSVGLDLVITSSRVKCSTRWANLACTSWESLNWQLFMYHLTSWT